MFEMAQLAKFSVLSAPAKGRLEQHCYDKENLSIYGNASHLHRGGCGLAFQRLSQGVPMSNSHIRTVKPSCPVALHRTDGPVLQQANYPLAARGLTD